MLGQWLKRDALLRAERDRLSRLIDEGFDQGLLMVEMCAAYQTINWVLDPEGHAPPSAVGAPKQKLLRVVK